MSKFKILQDDDILVVFNESTGVQIVIADDFIQYYTVTQDTCDTDLLKIRYSKKSGV